MAIKDILVTLTSYPEPTPISAVEDAIAVAAALEAHITALSCEVHVEVPGHFLSGSVVGLPGVIAGETGKSRKNAQDLIATFDAAAAKFGVSVNPSFRSASRQSSRSSCANMHDFAILRSCRS